MKNLRNNGFISEMMITLGLTEGMDRTEVASLVVLIEIKVSPRVSKFSRLMVQSISGSVNT